jgi:hypothetical protein
MFGGQEGACVPYGMYAFDTSTFFLLNLFWLMFVGACWESTSRTADASFFDA